MTPCPNCRNPMAAQSVEAYATLRPIEIESCAACNLVWFDPAESLRLTPRAVLELFRYIGQAGAARTPLAANFRCPRCSRALAHTHDVQRTTPFTYWRCRDNHGRLITFAQFLREKNFIRAPSPSEFARLRDTVRQVQCSQCGAPIDLATDSACTHCGAAVALIDPEGVAKAVQELSARASAAAPADPYAVRNAARDAQVEAIFDAERIRERVGSDDLLAIGATAIGALVAGWLRSR